MEARVALKASDESRLLQMVKAFEAAPSTWDLTVWTESSEHDVLVADSPVAGAVLFDPEQPGAVVGDVENKLARGFGHTTVVTGARRGTGVTTLALHLASALAARHDVVLVDLDPYSSLRPRLDLPDDARDWGSIGESVRDAALPVPAGFRVLLAPVRSRGGDVVQLLRAAIARFERVIVDVPRSPWLGAALGIATRAVLVVPPSRQGIRAARDTVEERSATPWTCVVNRLGAGGELSRTAIERELGRPVAVELPSSPFLRDREDDHRLLTERWSRYYRRVSRLAAAL